MQGHFPILTAVFDERIDVGVPCVCVEEQPRRAGDGEVANDVRVAAAGLILKQLRVAAVVIANIYPNNRSSKPVQIKTPWSETGRHYYSLAIKGLKWYFTNNTCSVSTVSEAV